MLLYFTVQAFFLVLIRATEHTYYVKPDNFSTNCSSQEHSCLTLDDYASNQSEFFTSNSTFLFLPGTHTTRTIVFLVNVSGVRFIGCEFSETDFTIECTNVSDIMVQGLLLRLTGGESNTTMTFINSSDILVMHAIFQGTVQHQTRAILLEHSIATFTNCTFRENMGVSLGGGILVRERSKALVSNSTFIKNTALLNGGAVFVNQSEFWVSESVFTNNSADEAGGIFAFQSLLITSSTDFVSNSARVAGAAAVFQNADCKFSNTTVMGNFEAALFSIEVRLTLLGHQSLKKISILLLQQVVYYLLKHQPYHS